MQESLDWAEAEEKKELDKIKTAEKTKNKESSTEIKDPMADPSNREWVDKQLKKAKELYGDDFGEDLDINFIE